MVIPSETANFKHSERLLHSELHTLTARRRFEGLLEKNKRSCPEHGESLNQDGDLTENI
jgi:hypothetical protein